MALLPTPHAVNIAAAESCSATTSTTSLARPSRSASRKRATGNGTADPRAAMVGMHHEADLADVLRPS